MNSSGDITNVITHVGADHFLREVYSPLHSSLDIDVINNGSGIDLANGVPGRICGPLCFEGDILVEREILSDVAQGNYLVIKNTGANTYSLWSRHCSRAFPKVITYDSTNENIKMQIDGQKKQSMRLQNFGINKLTNLYLDLNHHIQSNQ